MRNIKSYSMITQFIFQVLVLGLIGYFIGYKINPKSTLCGILAIVGVNLGVGVFIIQIIRSEWKNEREK